MKRIVHALWHKEPQPLSRAEFIIATFSFVLAVIFLPEDMRANRFGDVPLGEILVSTEFLRGLTIFIVLYVGFLALNFYAVPLLAQKATLWKGILIAVIAFTAIGISFGRFDVCLPSFMIFATYTAVRYAAIYLWGNADNIHKKFRLLSPPVLATLFVWLLGWVPAILSREEVIVAFWFTAVPATIFLYTYSFHSLIPRTISRRRPFLAFMIRQIGLAAVCSAAVGLIALAISAEEDAASIFAIMTFLFNVFFAAPVTWLLFKKSASGKELTFLKKELGHSSASLDFLRSQINPHFLFNALNTLYGTAILEKAEKTGEGIQRLGDMMRFMLHENMQETIPLTREVEYLKNYIALQRLRTDGQPSVRVETAIDQDVYFGSIPPMLLIPFVENAFKHGISFREPSHIRITLDASDKAVNFDVYNSKHVRQGNDPEKDNNGIGLANVKQRLDFLYPKRHELTIRETATEFFVHLTLQLSLSR